MPRFPPPPWTAHGPVALYSARPAAPAPLTPRRFPAARRLRPIAPASCRQRARPAACRVFTRGLSPADSSDVEVISEVYNFSGARRQIYEQHVASESEICSAGRGGGGGGTRVDHVRQDCDASHVISDVRLLSRGRILIAVVLVDINGDKTPIEAA